MTDPSPEPVLWMVVHHDTHGTGGVVRDGLGEAEARAMADAYEARGHHQGYTALPYTASTKAEVMRRERVLA